MTVSSLTKIFVIVLMVFGFTALHAQDVKKLSLEESIKIGFENSKQLHTYESRMNSAEARLSEINAGRLPSLNFNATYTRLSKIDPFTLSTPFGSFDLSPNINNSYNFKLGLQQPLFTGFRLKSSSEIAEYSTFASKESYRKEEQNLEYNIKNAYWGLFKAQKIKEVIDENVEQIKAHLKDVENFYKAGLATNNDVLKIQVQLAEAQLRQIDIKNSVQLAMVNLNNVIGIPLSTKTEITDEINRTESINNSLDELTISAIQNRPDIKATDYLVKASETGITLAQSGWFPQVYLAGNYYYSNPNQRYFPVEEKFKSNWDVSVMLSFDLWNWGKTSHQTTQAEMQFEESKDMQKILKDAVILEVTQSYLNLLQSKEKLSVSEFSVKQAEENYRVSSELFKQGLTLNSELLDAEVALLQAKTNYVQTMVDLELAKANLEKSVGGL